MKLIKFFGFVMTSLIGLISCENLLNTSMDNQHQITTATATVESRYGFLIFINSIPVKPYDNLGEPIRNDALGETIEAGKGKKILEAASSVISSIGGNIDFDNLLNKMLKKVKEKYPDAQGVIFSDKLSTCQAIKFKEEN